MRSLPLWKLQVKMSSMELIKKLRDTTGSGIVDCKKALSENNNDIEQLIKIIKKKDPIYSALSLYFIIENDLVNDQKKINNFFDLVIKSQEEREIKNLIIYKKADNCT